MSKTTESPIKVVITGAAGQIAYSLLYSVAKGDVFGKDQPVILALLDIPVMMSVLNGVVMELQDCSLPLVVEMIATDSPETAFKDADAAMLVGAMPRREGMERKDLLLANAKIFESMGTAIDKHAKKTIKVVVVGNPANTNALICQKNATSIPKENFTALTRLDQNRAQSQIASRLGVSSESVKNCIIWGNHSSTQFPDVEHAKVITKDGEEKSVRSAVQDDNWLNNDFIKTVQQRGAAVIQARKLSSAMSAAKAIVDHMHDWWFGTKPGQFVSMGVISDGSYGITEGLMYSFPVTIKDKTYQIVKDLNIGDFARNKMSVTENELKEEKKAAFAAIEAQTTK